MARGNVWTANTAVAGITVTTLMIISTASAIPIVGLYNPVGSGKNLFVHRAVITQCSGTVANFVWGAVAAPAMTVANGLASTANLLNLTTQGQARNFAGATAMVGTATAIRFFPGQYDGAGPAAGTLVGFRDDVDGELCVAPGNFCGIFSVIVTTAGLVRATIVWAELPV